MTPETIVALAVYGVFLAIVGVILCLWVYPKFLPAHVEKPLTGLTVILLVLLWLARALGYITWPI